MKAGVARMLLLSALIMFGVMLVMILAGCLAGACGAGDTFFCRVYCPIGKILLVSGLVFIAFLSIREARLKG
ncbi:MAG: hypothetical protein ACOYXB_08660 [Bacteroidota bacterium]